ncbi:MAG: pseudouridine synthase [Xanthomonadales bacterium]|nr:pseudouridine synthase [Xanthomonadales bacterium]
MNKPPSKTYKKADKKMDKKPSKKMAGKTDEKPENDEIIPGERLQKVMANAGLGSRRGLDKEIDAGHVSVNGKVAILGEKVNLGDKVTFHENNWEVAAQSAPERTLIYNKPLGEITSRSDPQGRPTVFERLPKLENSRWIAVGRLDINTTGLMLLTTDGELAHKMMHPSSKIDREYACRIHGEVSDEVMQTLRDGVELDDGPARFSDIQRAGHSGENYWFHVVIMEGRNREVRRLWASQGLEVSRLKRVRYGPVFLPSKLKRGMFTDITLRDHNLLREEVKLTARAHSINLKPIGTHSQAAKAKWQKKPGKKQGQPRAQRRFVSRRFK